MYFITIQNHINNYVINKQKFLSFQIFRKRGGLNYILCKELTGCLWWLMVISPSGNKPYDICFTPSTNLKQIHKSTHWMFSLVHWLENHTLFSFTNALWHKRIDLFQFEYVFSHQITFLTVNLNKNSVVLICSSSVTRSTISVHRPGVLSSLVVLFL